MLLRLHRDLLRRSMEHCCVYLVACTQQFSGINAVLGIEGEAAGPHSPLNRGPGHITGTCGFREGEFGHASMIHPRVQGDKENPQGVRLGFEGAHCERERTNGPRLVALSRLLVSYDLENMWRKIR